MIILVAIFKKNHISNMSKNLYMYYRKIYGVKNHLKQNHDIQEVKQAQ